MARVELSERAARDLQRLILTHDLPGDTAERVQRRLEPVGTFPLMGPALDERWAPHRYVLGPWRWMVIVYRYFEEDDRVVIVTIQDGRSSAAPRPAGQD